MTDKIIKNTNIQNTQHNDVQDGGWRGRGFGRGSGRYRFMGPRFQRRGWYRPQIGIRRFYRPNYVYAQPPTQVVTQIREVEKPAFTIQNNVNGFCGKTNGIRKVCKEGLMCDNDNKCVTYREDIDTNTMKNRVFRLCRDENDNKCIDRRLL